MKLTAFIAILTIVFSSCSNKYSLQKRRYTKGYYIAHSGKKTEQNLKVEKTENLKLASTKSDEETEKVFVTTVKEEKKELIQEQSLVKTEQLKSAKENQEPALIITRSQQKKGGIAGAEKEEVNPPYQYGYGYSNGGMGAWGIIGAVSSIISLIIFLIYLAVLLDAFSGGTLTGPIIVGIIVIVLIVAVVGIVLAISMGGI